MNLVFFRFHESLERRDGFKVGPVPRFKDVLVVVGRVQEQVADGRVEQVLVDSAGGQVDLKSRDEMTVDFAVYST